MTRLLPLMLLAACANDMAIGAPTVDDGDTGAPVDNVVQLFHLDVEPINNDFAGEILLPQTFGPFVEGEGFELRMVPAVRFSGAITAERLGPWLGALPTEAVQASGALSLVDEAGRVVSETRVDADAGFSLLTQPGTVTLVFSPEDPTLPAWEQALALLEDTRLDLDLGLGHPLWGRVLDADGVGVSEVGVYAQGAAGAVTATTWTDAQGWYELRVGPGTWTPIVAGRTTRRDPVVLGDALAIGDEGGRVDVQLAEARSVDLTARLVDLDDEPVVGVRVQITATSLAGYADGRASYQVEVLSDSRGYLDTRLPAGQYQVAVLPDATSPLAPVLQDGVNAFNNADLGVLMVAPLRAVTTTLLDPTGAPLASAPVACRELTPSPRTWTTTTSADGAVLLTVPDGPARCDFSPPGARGDLARLLLDTSGLEFPTSVTLPTGEPVSGAVVFDPTGVPLPRALVSLRDEADAVRGQHTTDEAGAFTLQVWWDE
jgi:hypothetical protein